MKPIVRIAMCQDGRVPAGKSTLQTEAQCTMIGETFKFIPWLHLPLVLVNANIFIVGANIFFIVCAFNMLKVEAKSIDTEAWLVWRGL